MAIYLLSLILSKHIAGYLGSTAGRANSGTRSSVAGCLG
jgi:hypothetical protein